MKRLLDFCNRETAIYTLVRFDPAVNRAVKYAIADGLMHQQANGLYRLTTKGKHFAESIKEDAVLLMKEKMYLNDLAEKLTEDKIKELVAIWRYTDVQNK